MKIEVKAPDVGESINEVTIGSWFKKDGDWVEMDDVLCEIESEKATMEVVSEHQGVIKILAPQGTTVTPGTPIAQIEISSKKENGTGEKENSAKAEPQPVSNELKTKPPQSEKLRITPVAKKILEEKQIDEQALSALAGNERITKKILENFLNETEDYVPAAKEAADEKSAKEVSMNSRGERREPMSTLRRTIAEHLLKARQSTAMLTTFNEVDMSEVIRLRDEYKESFLQKFGVKLGFMSFFIKAVCQALQEFPLVNARIDGDDIVFYEYVDIGVAVSTDRGLVVPVIRDVQKMSLAEMEKEVARLAKAARDKKLSIEEMKGGTFSITNGGVFGSLLSTPLINIPQSAILGMHNIQERPVAVQGQVVIRPMMYLALSYDHRLIDGRESVQFLLRIKEIIERPVRLLLDV